MESTRFRRRSELPGVEVLEVSESQRPWRCFTSAFELMLPESWSGHVTYRGARHWLEPGMLFCPVPGDTFELSRADTPGSFRTLMLDREVLCRVLDEHQLTPESLDLQRVVRAVPVDLKTALVRLFDDVTRQAPVASLGSSLLELGSALAQLGRAERPTKPAVNARAAERVRELLHADLEGTLDLGALSRETGLSRFQVLRVFKRAYGLPPHAYQLCMRIARAKRLLCLGHRPAYVATELCFSDQSHLNRHFKRLLGVTPSEYAQAAAG